MSFTVKNRLEVLQGNKILVPGCEPTSAFTSPTLAENRECTASVVDLADALVAVPGSTVIYMSNPRRKFFVLPDGPPPAMGDCDCKVNDWYQKLKDISTEIDVDSLSCSPLKRPYSVGEICDTFPLKGFF